MRNRSRGSVIGGIAVVLLVLGAGVWFFFLRSNAPPEVDLDSATEQLTSTTAEDGTTTTTAKSPEGIQGTWVIDNESGEFDFESASGSFAGYRVTEELASIGSSEAVGRTGAVSGEMVIEGTTMTSTDVTVDLSDIQSDKPRRDDRVLEALNTDRFPNATFQLTESVDLGTGAADGDEVSVDATGDLTINGVTNEVTMTLDAQLVDGTAVVVGSIPIALADFDIEVPSAPVVLSVSDEATIEFQLLFTPQTVNETTTSEPAT